MKPLKELESLIKELITCPSTNVEKTLKKMGRILCSNALKLKNNVILQPLWAEPYYYGDNFKDPNPHFILAQASKERFMHLSVHKKTSNEGIKDLPYCSKDKESPVKKGRGGRSPGLDITLHFHDNNNKYYLSFLLKKCLLNGSIKTDKELNEIFESFDIKDRKCIFIDSDVKKNIGYCKRIGLKNNDFADLKITAYNKDFYNSKGRLIKK